MNTTAAAICISAATLTTAFVVYVVWYTRPRARKLRADDIEAAHIHPAPQGHPYPHCDDGQCDQCNQARAAESSWAYGGLRAELVMACIVVVMAACSACDWCRAKCKGGR